MSNWQPIDLTGDPQVEEQIRQYYNRKKSRNPEAVFVEGVATEPRQRAEFTIDNSYMHKVPDEAIKLHNRANSTAWNRHYKADKIRRKYEELQVESYAANE